MVESDLERVRRESLEVGSPAEYRLIMTQQEKERPVGGGNCLAPSPMPLIGGGAWAVDGYSAWEQTRS